MRLAVILAFALTLAACGAPPDRATYRIEGPAGQRVTVTYRDDGYARADRVTLPWMREVIARPGQLASITAQRIGGIGGPLACTLVLGGVTAASDAHPALVQCRAVVPAVEAK